MTTAATTLLGLALPVTGELSGTWGDTVNNSITSLLDTAVAGTTTLSTDADVTLTTTTLASNQARQAILLCSGARTALRTITAPAQSKIYTIINATTGGFSVKLVGVGPTTGLTIPNGASAVVAWNGSDFIEVGSATVGNLTVNGNLSVTGTTSLTGVATLTANPVLSAGTANGVAYLNGSKVVTTGSALYFDGTSLGVGTTSPVFSNSGQGVMINGTTAGTVRVTQGGGTQAGEFRADSSHVYIGSRTNGSLIFEQFGSEGMRLTSTGLGIGTSSPSSKLQVNGNLRVEGATSEILMAVGAERTISASGSASSTALTFKRWNGSTYVNDVVMDGSGNLGLGVTPSAWGSAYKVMETLGGSVGGNTAGLMTIHQNAYNNAGWKYRNSLPASIYEQSAGSHVWYNAPSGTAGNAITFTQAMTLDASGNLGIGASSPAAPLSFASATGQKIRFYNGLSGYGIGVESSEFRFVTDNSASFTWGIGTYSSPSEQMRLTSTGLGIGTSSPSKRLQVVDNQNAGAGLLVSNNSAGASAQTQINFTNGTHTHILGIAGTNYTTYGVITANSGFLYTGGNQDLALAADGTGVIKFGTGGGVPEKMRLDASGNLGLGLTPSGTWGTQALMLGKSGASNPTYPFIASTDTQILTIGSNSYWDGTNWKAAFAGAAVTAAQQRIKYNEITWHVAAAVSQGTTQSFTQAMTLDASGNLGVGTTSPSARLEVSDTTSAAATALVQLTGQNNYELNIQSLTTTNSTVGARYNFAVNSSNGEFSWSNSGGERARIDSSGNLLVGSTSTSGLITGQLQLGTTSSSTAGIQVLNSTTGVGGIYFGDSSSGNARFRGMVEYNHNADALVLSTAETERARIDNSGNLLIGRTTVPVTNTAGVGIQYNGLIIAESSQTQGGLWVNRITSDGNAVYFTRQNVLIGTISVTGSATAYNTSSDYRLKENIQPMTGALAKVAALKPVTYKWKADGSDGEGFIAHELAEVVPQCVTGEKDAVDEDGKPVYQGIDTSFLVATLTAALQEAVAEINQLKADVAALKGN